MSNRSQHIAGVLTKAILSHRLIPGVKLGERELAEVFGVSRIVVRQALIRISEDGLAQIERHRGAFVAKPSLQEAMEIYDTQTLLEQGIAVQLAERLGPAGWGELRQHIERQRLAVESGNWALADKLAHDFHTLFIRLGRNRVIEDIYAQLIRRESLLQSLYNNDFDYHHLLDEHEKIVDLLEKRQVKKAQALIETHHRNVVRGYIMDGESHPELSIPDALAPYLNDEKTNSNSGSKK